MANLGNFPFGQPVKPVIQKDQSPKEVFILGVYASAVHARWLSPEGETLINALAVTSEPEIFWNGTGARKILAEISIPKESGKLIPADQRFNGPSGRSLDKKYLEPLGLSRSDTWLCDLYPYAHLNKNQMKAIQRVYLPRMNDLALPQPTIKSAPTKKPSEERLEEISKEIQQSRAKVLILLGDKPIIWFLHSIQPEYKRLRDFGKNRACYGRVHRMDIHGKEINVLPLVHPRQASSLGKSTAAWTRLHQEWKENTAGNLL